MVNDLILPVLGSTAVVSQIILNKLNKKEILVDENKNDHV